MSHPDSAGLRQLADLLDAAPDLKCGNLYLNFHSVAKDQVRPMIKALGLDCPKPQDGETYGDLGRKKFGSLDVSIYGRYADVCTPRKVMREVTVYDCDCTE